MNKKIRSVLIATGVAGATLAGTLAGAQTASAASLFDDQNYGRLLFSAGTAANVGDASDRASSLLNSDARTYYEDSGYLGRTISLTGNINFLQSYSTNLHFGETWNDRISSFR
ncbi:hypothetical protein ITJ38_17675 [Agreia pratensis]|uniref:hypothetical protein n=1 Tax=Agreia pratensis TaxID=150121 RepID=UPI00188D6211|nr:hypothetical protein [Agreia pratensis]MBF4636244.1 hypothetical protein [Agreia pratensis]